jgi:hypothetical protein
MAALGGNCCFVCMNKISIIYWPNLVMSVGHKCELRAVPIMKLYSSCVCCRAWHVVLHRLQHMQLLCR